MEWILKGIAWGLFLAIMVGPLLFTLIQESIEKGFRAGISVGIGIWISDLLIIVITYYGIHSIAKIIETDSFQWTMAILGSIVLFTIGIATILSKATKYEPHSAFAKPNISYITLAVKGFLINTINPFTIAFWTSLIAAVVLKQNLTKVESYLFLGAILGTIISMDSLKVILAKKIRPYMKPHYIQRVRQVAGFALVVFGIVMLGKVFFQF